MPVALEEKTQFRQIGNSLGIIVPANIRKSADFSAGDEVAISTPRSGVITITSFEHKSKNKAQTWSELQDFIAEHISNDSCWPKNKTFKEVLNEARDERF